MNELPPIIRQIGETWRDAVSRVGGYADKAFEALRLYDMFLCQGHSEQTSAAMVRHEYNASDLVVI